LKAAAAGQRWFPNSTTSASNFFLSSTTTPYTFTLFLISPHAPGCSIRPMGTNIEPNVLIILFTAALQKDGPSTIFVRRGASLIRDGVYSGLSKRLLWKLTRGLGREIPRDLPRFPRRQANGWVVQHLHGRLRFLFLLFLFYRTSKLPGRRGQMGGFEKWTQSGMYIEWDRLTGRCVSKQEGEEAIGARDTHHLTLQKRRQVG
jgi:hypothetical protein